MAKNSFFDKDTGWDKLVTSFENTTGESAVFVGFLRSSGLYKKKAKGGKMEKGEEITVAQVAAINEFGSSDGRIPERSFMRSAVDANQKKIERTVEKLTTKVVDGEMTEKKALGVLGALVQSLMRKRITEGVPPPNAPSTLAHKGSGKGTLVDTSQMINAIDFEVTEGKRK